MGLLKKVPHVDIGELVEKKTTITCPEEKAGNLSET
jgi:hypothetical protein